jgi:hypothetical protein
MEIITYKLQISLTATENYTSIEVFKPILWKNYPS